MKKFPSGAAIEIFETLDSTSLEAKRRIAAGAKGPSWIIALNQTAGYGRRGRGWEQAAGDFAGTLLFTPEGAPDSLGQLSFVVALALASALDEFVPPDRVTLKWPNDVLLDGKKVAGVLLEHSGAEGPARLAAGIGVNIVSAPENLPYPAARLVDYAAAPSPPELAARIDDHFHRYYADWKGRGFAPIRDVWLARAAGIGGDIVVRLPNEELSGVFEGIDETGALMLRSPAGRRTIAAGEVFFAPKPGN